MNTSRRLFLTSQMLEKAAGLAADMKTAYREGKSRTDYFSSFESCYPLVSEYAYFIDDEVKALGIDTAGLSPEQVAEIVYAAKQKKQEGV